MGPQVVMMTPAPMVWAVLVMSFVLGAVLAYEIAMSEPTSVGRWPRWPWAVVKFAVRWYPRVVVPILITLGWLWQ